MRRVELSSLIAAATAGFAAWISLGSLAVATVDTSSRFGFLPPLWMAPAMIVVFCIAAWWLRLSRETALPLFFSLILILPWIPGPVPAVFLLWTGPVVYFVWLTTVASMIIAKKGRVHLSPALSEKCTRPLFAGAIALTAYLAAGWWLSALLPGGDEPHYLVITQSLLRDGDIRVENNYVENQYREYFGRPLSGHFGRRGINGERYSIHAPGLAALVLPAFALLGYPGVVAFLALIAAAGGVMLWRASYALTGSVAAAWFAWAAGTLTVPFFFEAFAVYPDGVAGTLVLFAALPLVEERVSRTKWMMTGAALGLLPWLHTRFAIISIVLGLVLLLRLMKSSGARARIAAFLSVPAACAIAWFAFFRIVYGRFDPSVPYGVETQTSARSILNGFPALLFDQQFGILPNAPVYGLCFAGLIVLARQRLRLAVELAAVWLAYHLAVSTFHMWWAGSSAPARFLAPILPLMALPAAWWWSSSRHLAARSVAIAALLMSVTTTAVLVSIDGGLLAYNVRDGYAKAADWINPLVDISLGMPSFFRQTTGGAVLRAWIWIAIITAAVLSLRLLERKGGTRAAFALATPVAMGMAMMCALSAVWALDGVAASNTEKSQLSLLADYDSARRPLGVTLQPLALNTAGSVLPRIGVITPTRHGPSPLGTLLLAPAVVPGGSYQLRLSPEAPKSGVARLVIGRLARPVKTWDLASDFRDGAASVELPVSVGSLVVTGDQHAPAGVITLHPTQIWEGRSRLTREIARRVERYGPALAFFFDLSATYLEEQGFWVRGGRETHVAVAPATRGAQLQLFVRNAAAMNRVLVEIDGESQALDLQSREERTLPLPIGGDRPGALVRLSSQNGFRPSEVEAGSRDTRFLGVWIEFR
jgi:hypothetical protein